MNVAVHTLLSRDFTIAGITLGGMVLVVLGALHIDQGLRNLGPLWMRATGSGLALGCAFGLVVALGYRRGLTGGAIGFSLGFGLGLASALHITIRLLYAKVGVNAILGSLARFFELVFNQLTRAILFVIAGISGVVLFALLIVLTFTLWVVTRPIWWILRVVQGRPARIHELFGIFPHTVRELRRFLEERKRRIGEAAETPKPLLWIYSRYVSVQQYLVGTVVGYAATLAGQPLLNWAFGQANGPLLSCALMLGLGVIVGHVFDLMIDLVYGYSLVSLLFGGQPTLMGFRVGLVNGLTFGTIAGLTGGLVFGIESHVVVDLTTALVESIGPIPWWARFDRLKLTIWGLVFFGLGIAMQSVQYGVVLR